MWPSSNGIIAAQDSREGIYLQIYENRREGDYELGLVTTEVRGEGECPRRHPEERGGPSVDEACSAGDLRDLEHLWNIFESKG